MWSAMPQRSFNANLPTCWADKNREEFALVDEAISLSAPKIYYCLEEGRPLGGNWMSPQMGWMLNKVKDR